MARGKSYNTKAMEARPTNHRGYFTRVEAAREALRARAHEILKLYIHNAKLATKKGDYETAQKSYKWLLEHMPAGDTGVTVIGRSIDKELGGEGKLQPAINIGIALGGIGSGQKQLPVAVDILELPEDVESK